MKSRKQLANVIDKIVSSKETVEEVETSTIDEYKKLNEKCDTVIGKIKERKSKRKS